MSTYNIIPGDALQGLATLPAESVQTCITSPPYYGLRDYGVEGQIGLEDTPDAFVARLVQVFREVRRVLKNDGCIWLNLGDSYTGSANSGGTNRNAGGPAVRIERLRSKGGDGLKPKDLIGIPWRVALALQADGWYLRQDIIWAKPNPMPESVRDRCTKAHEYLFLLSKSPRYYFNADAIKEPAVTVGDTRHLRTDKTIEFARPDGGSRARTGQPQAATRNKRSVWTVTPTPFKGSHFAVFPEKLIEPCVLAGSKPGDTVLDPFTGAATTALVALKHGRRFVGCELNPSYIELAHARLAAVAPQKKAA